jgi:hypothetical protein
MSKTLDEMLAIRREQRTYGDGIYADEPVLEKGRLTRG